MADRMFREGAKTLDIDLVTLYASATIGASGAVASSSAGTNGVTTVARTSAGKYTITLDDKYTGFRWADVKVLAGTLGDPNTAGILATLFSQDVASAKTVVFQFQNVTDGAAADPADGAVLYFKIDLKNSSV